MHLLLESFGCDCETAADGTSDLTHVDEGGWDLVLTDLAMPKMSGWEVVEAIRQRAPTLPIVLMTGLNSPDVMRRATVWGLQILSKPFLMQTFKATVVEALYLKAS